jgi:hypothetical protein
MAKCEWLDYGLKNRHLILDRGKDFSLRHHVQLAYKAHPTSIPMSTGAVSSGIKRPRCKADHSLSSNELYLFAAP